MKAWMVLAVALLLGGCGARTLDYTPSAIDPALGRASIEQVLRGLPGKRGPDKVFVTPDYFGYARGPLYAEPAANGETPKAAGKSVQVQVYYKDVSKVDLIEKNRGRTIVLVRNAKGRNLYKAVVTDLALAHRFADAVMQFKR
ncbi:hypothetical protein [Pseudomonas sp. RIT-PI-S]|uniref:hypothetical protein n=1 Tax=Pseudomonas sp. RIT-PI-S TaxID=3035295 RepID=UPI0021DB37ED|nr:hypothetical protein [Pseudomonas sp. RIT-PI-S]